MTYEQLQDRIVSGIWSADLKKHIAQQKCSFTEEELLGIAFHFSPTFAERLEMLGLLAAYAPSVSAHAARCVEWQQGCLERFCRLEEQEIYELRIKDEPDSWEECYLCGSYDTALRVIDEFYKAYSSAEEREHTRYTIVKRKILQPGAAFCEDKVAECVLGPGKVLLTVDAPYGETENGTCCHSCLDCKEPCILNLEVCFPTCIPHRSPVRYRKWDGSLHYGIHLNFSDEQRMDACYIIPLDGEMLKNRSYDETWGWHWHEHIPCPDVETVPLGELAGDLRENYHAFTAWLDTKADFR